MRPLKNPRLKAFKKGTKTVGSIDGKTFYELPPEVLYVLTLCDGKRTTEEVGVEVAREARANANLVAKALNEALPFLQKIKFVEVI